MKAFLKNNRQAPRKVALVADLVRGKNVAVALSELSVMPHKGARTIKKLVASAAANARQKDASLSDDKLTIATITVNKGITYTRYMPRAFGRATPINRECSHIRVELAPVNIASSAETESSKPEVKKQARKTAPKDTSTEAAA